MDATELGKNVLDYCNTYKIPTEYLMDIILKTLNLLTTLLRLINFVNIIVAAIVFKKSLMRPTRIGDLQWQRI